jgi:hexosaminidase
LHKFNTFHWHLTDDQGWRIEIKKYPKLTSVGGWRNGTIIGRYPGTGNDNLHYGGFYTQAEIKDIVKYAAQRFITIIPEIEMPGHASAAIAAYPELSCFPNESTFSFYPKQCVWSGDTAGKQVQQTWGVFDDVFCAGKENTFKVLQDVLDEVLTLFPSRYIHIGGDECPKENWKRCALCQQRMKDEHLKDEHELQSYFIQRVEKYLNGKGRRIIGWDEILEGGLAPNATVMSWRGEQGGIDAAKQNHDVIMTPGNPVYFDHSQSTNEDSVTIGGYNPIEKVYAYEPIPKELNEAQAKHILGAQANMWTEYMAYPSKVEYHLFPRIAALSEVLWSPKETKNWENFQIRLSTLFKRYDLMKINYSKAYFDLKTSVLPTDNNNGVQWKLETKLKSGKIKYKVDDNKKFSTYLSPVKVNKSTVLKGFFYNGTKLESVVTEKFHFNKATGKKITLTKDASPNYPGDGAFTLVNGVINEKGLGKSREFLGFSGDDCEVVIDLGNKTDVKNVIVHGLTEKGSWIYPYKNIELKISTDGENFNDVSFDATTDILDIQHLRTSLLLKIISQLPVI